MQDNFFYCLGPQWTFRLSSVSLCTYLWPCFSSGSDLQFVDCYIHWDGEVNGVCTQGTIKGRCDSNPHPTSTYRSVSEGMARWSEYGEGGHTFATRTLQRRSLSCSCANGYRQANIIGEMILWLWLLRVLFVFLPLKTRWGDIAMSLHLCWGNVCVGHGRSSPDVSQTAKDTQDTAT